MKNCNEMVNSLLERREQYETEKRSRRKMLTRTITPLCCMCLVALLGFGAWQGGMFEKQPIQTAEDAVVPGIKDWYGPGEEELAVNQYDNSSKEDTVNPAITYSLSINEIVSEDVDGLFSTAAWLDPGEENFHEMTRDEVLEYFGAELNLSEVSQNYLPAESERYGFYHFADGGILDQQTFSYVNDTGAEINITLRKGKLPMYSIVGEHLNKMETSQIGDYSVVVVHYTGFDGQSVYYAEFMKAGNGYSIITNGVSVDSLTDVLTILLK